MRLEQQRRKTAGTAAEEPGVNRIDGYFPETGPFRRELYRKHLEFFRNGATARERLFLAANRIGKTESAGGYEVVLHLTGEYPDWWEGRRFELPIEAWAAGDTSKTVRDIIQQKLLGQLHERGTGLIRRKLIVRTTLNRGLSDAVQDIYVRHRSGGTSVLTLKSYDQGRRSFQGTGKHVIWLDEEPPLEIYTECLMRTMTTDGMVLCTFTPLQGLSNVVLSFLSEQELSSVMVKAA